MTLKIPEGRASELAAPQVGGRLDKTDLQPSPFEIAFDGEVLDASADGSVQSAPAARHTDAGPHNFTARGSSVPAIDALPSCASRSLML